MSTAVTHGCISDSRSATLHEKLNSRWHERALQLFMLVVLGHWAEHIAQAWQIYVLNPWLVKSELLHYSYALVMLLGMWTLRKGFTGLSLKWWNLALWIQVWHHFEHLLLITQATLHQAWFGAHMPTSILQLFFPRIELHLFYNTVVFIPMVIGMYYHMYPRQGEEHAAFCTCSRRPVFATAS
jgi:hypothetical protein